MTNATVPIGSGFRKALQADCGGAMDTVVAEMLKASDGTLLINAKALALAVGIRNRMPACVSALKRAVKRYKGTIDPATKDLCSGFTVTLVAPE